MHIFGGPLNIRTRARKRVFIAITAIMALAASGYVALPANAGSAVDSVLESPSNIKTNPDGPTLEVGARHVVWGTPCPESVLRLWDRAEHPDYWTPDAEAFGYQWLRNDVEIAGETSREYKVLASDRGTELSLRLTALRTGWAPTVEHTDKVRILKCPAPFPAGPLPLIGSIAVGELISVGGAWDPHLHMDFSWVINGWEVGKNARTYTPRPSDAGKNVQVFVTAWRDGHAPSYAETKPTKILPGKLKNTKNPSLWAPDGMRVGELVYALPETYAMGTMVRTYQWYRDGRLIPNATKDHRRIVPEDVHHRIRAKVTFKPTGYEPVALWTNSSSKVELNELKSKKKPTISGSSRFGSTLTVSKGTWNAHPSSHSYQWYRGAKPIKGAQKSKYKLGIVDIGHKITAKVSVKRPKYKSASAMAARKHVYLAKFTSVRKPVITGTRKVGYTLTAKPGTSSPKATSFTYQWYRSDKTIKGANKRTYKTTSADKNKKISVRVTAKRSHYGNASQKSSAIVVKPKPKPVTPDDWESDYSWNPGSSPGKAPNRCYAPGGRTYTYC